MQLRYDEDLIEAVVFFMANLAGKAVPSLQVVRFHREREKAYSILDPDERNTAFFETHLVWFREWGLETAVTERLKEFPLLSEKLEVLALRKTQRKSDEGSELYVQHETGQHSGVLALSPDRFGRPEELQQFLRHELSHLQDMVDPAFGYQPVLSLPGLNTTQQRQARERYRLLWDISIDGRLAAAGRGSVSRRELHEAAFADAFAFWPSDRVLAVFDSLWNDPAPSHLKFVNLLEDPSGFRGLRRPGPGASCPLCGFSTFRWAEVDALSPAALSLIQDEFPDWLPEQRLCARCAAVYEVASQTGPGMMANPHT